jgi:hypothetical protein
MICLDLTSIPYLISSDLIAPYPTVPYLVAIMNAIHGRKLKYFHLSAYCLIVIMDYEIILHLSFYLPSLGWVSDRKGGERKEYCVS